MKQFQKDYSELNSSLCFYVHTLAPVTAGQSHGPVSAHLDFGVPLGHDSKCPPGSLASQTELMDGQQRGAAAERSYAHQRMHKPARHRP